MTMHLESYSNIHWNLIRDSLTEDDIRQLVENEIFVLTVRNFYKSEYCAHIASKIQNTSEGAYRNAPTIGKIGMAYFETDNIPELIEHYYSKAIPSMEFVRELCSPCLSPLDYLRLRLDEVWNAGAKIESFHGRKMFTGLCRIVEPDVDFLPHQDIAARDMPNNHKASSLLAQLAANIYVATPATGGELHLWNVELPKKTYDELRQGVYGIDRRHFSHPDVVVKPEPGDLILFNARKMHAVAPSRGRARIAMSTFIGYRGDQQALTFWS